MSRASLLRPAPSFLLVTTLAFVSVSTAGCPGDTGGDAGPTPTPESSGTVVRDGEEVAYTFDAERSDFVITVGLNNGLICGSFHEHAVEATSVGLEFVLDPDDAAASTMNATVASSGLRPDAPALREKYLTGTSQEPVPQGDISGILGSVLANVGAEINPTLSFVATNFSDLAPGATGTVDVTVDVNGGIQTITMEYDLVESGDELTFTGSGILPGGPHGIPSGFASDCVNEDLGLFLELVLVPGENNADIDAGVVVYNPQTFPYEGDCVDKISFNEARDVVVGRCAGCHSDPPLAGATIPLVTYDDFRVDSLRHQAVAIFETAGHFMERPLDASEGIPMPPGSASQLTTEEKDLALAWIAQGAPDCLDLVEPTTFTPIAAGVCGDVSYDDDVKDIIDLQCIGCHSTTQTEIPHLEDYDSGLALGKHGYYAPLTLWESSMHRILDHSMPTYSTPDSPALGALDVEKIQAWVADGYPKVHCP